MSGNTVSENVESQPELDFENLDNFSDSFFGKKEVQEEPAKPTDEAEVVETQEDVPPDENEDDVNESDDTTDEDDTDDDEGEETPEPPVKKNRAQERIAELNAKYREEERKRIDLETRLAELSSPEKAPPAPTKAVDADAPTPTDQTEDGEDKYPLGEFDPNFIRDLTKFTIAEAQKEADAQRAQAETNRADELKAQTLHNEWKEKQGPVQERYPDYSEKVASLEDVFSGIDPSYGEYLAETVMAMDKGPEVLYYLSNNPDEARNIVKLGGVRAAIQLGRLETQFLVEEKPQPKAKVSKAPTPPPQNKGSAGGSRSISPDTDDLDAFANEFFKKRK